MFDKKDLEAKLAEYEKQLEAAKQTFHQYLGAISAVKKMLAEMDGDTKA